MRNKLVHLLSPVGLVVAVLSQIPWIAAKLPGRPQVYLLAGLLLILLHLVLFFEQIVSLVGRRQLRYGGNTAALIGIVLAILGVGNYLVNRNTARWDLTKSRKYTLSDQTQKVVKGLQDELKVTHFFVQDDRTAQYRQEIQDRLREFAALSPHLKVHDVDVRKEPARARQYEVKAVPTLVFEYHGKRELITAGGEQDVTNAVIKVTREGKKSACFLKGEGERSTTDTGPRGYSSLKAALDASQYETRDVALSRDAKVLDACSLVVVGAPEKDLLPEAIAAIRSFVAGGGKALVMIEPDFKGPLANLTGLLGEWNIETGSDLVLELYSQLTAQGIVSVAAERVLVEQYPFHEITREFPFSTRFDSARSITAGASKPGVTAQSLIQSSDASWATGNLTLKEPIEFKEGRDKKGPVSIAVAATLTPSGPSPSPTPSPSPSPGIEEPKKSEARVVVFGDADFVSNDALGFQGNQNLILNVMAWLSGESDLISIRPRDPESHRLSVIAGSATHRLVVVASLLGLPGLFVFLGIASWWRRRA